MILYCTLPQAREAGNMTASTSVDNALLLRLIEVASARADGLMRWPAGALLLTRETVHIPITRHTWVSGFSTLLLPRVRPAVEIEQVTQGSGVIAFDVEGAPIPRALVLRGSVRLGVPVMVRGWWAARRAGVLPYVDVGTLTSALTASATTLPLTGLAVGQLLRINDELLLVSATTASNATVARGQRGTVAAAHAAGDAVRWWQVDPAVSWQVARQAAYLYSRRGAYETASSDGIGSQQLPPDLLAGLRGALDGYA